MYSGKPTPSIAVTIGRQTRVYHAFVTTAPSTCDAPATITLHVASFADIVGMAADPMHLELARTHPSARLVLVETTEFIWQRGRYREGRHLFAPADPWLVGLNTLQHWLWNRIGSPTAARPSANA